MFNIIVKISVMCMIILVNNLVRMKYTVVKRRPADVMNSRRYTVCLGRLSSKKGLRVFAQLTYST